jgi:hypothetical protein
MKDLGFLLQAEFSESEFVHKPEHPLLLRGPDALIGGPGNLCALFAPNGWEIDNPAHLATRLISSKLALPDNCRTVLLIEENLEGRFSRLDNDFGLVSSFEDKSLSKFLRDGTDYGASRKMESRIQKEVLKTYDRALTLTEKSYRINRSKIRDASPTYSLKIETQKRSSTLESGLFKYTPRNRIEIEGQPISVLSGRSRHNVIQQLMFAASGAILESYILDTGIPYPTKKSIHLVVSSLAVGIIDMRGKYVHGAAFAGTSLIPTDDMGVIQMALNARSDLIEFLSGEE